MILRARDRRIRFPRRALVMGIVNLNDDSFCGDGTLDPDAALSAARELIRQGAEIIDVGAESARTNRGPVSIEEEIRRLLPFVKAWRESVAEEPPEAADGGLHPPLLSINTWRPEVVEAVLPHGGDIINDMGGLPDERNARLCARFGAGLVIMHNRGEPKTPQTDATYPDIFGELLAFFHRCMAMCEAAGLPDARIILDPGIDFAKQRADNLRIYRHLERLHAFGRPLLVPVSRKTVIGEVLDLPDPLDRDAGTVACMARAVAAGAQILRVHNVPAAIQTVKVLDGILTAPVATA